MFRVSFTNKVNQYDLENGVQDNQPVLLIEVIHSKIKDLMKPHYIMTPEGLENG